LAEATATGARDPVASRAIKCVINQNPEAGFEKVKINYEKVELMKIPRVERRFWALLAIFLRCRGVHRQ
jgi:hypothetical protein